MEYHQLLLLGSIAGFTIFLGLPLAILQNISPNKKGFLNAIAVGILVFLIIIIFGHAWEHTADSVKQAFEGKSSTNYAFYNTIAMFGGLAIGLLGLVFYESRYMKKQKQIRQKRFSLSKATIKKEENTFPNEESQPDGYRIGSAHGRHAGKGLEKQQVPPSQPLIYETNAYNLSMMIAIGIGFHNFSEGMVFGQSFVSGSIGLALLLITGFESHNAMMGIGIACPLAGLNKKPKIGFIILLGLISGGPMFLGTIIGSLWISNIAFIFFMAIAGGALVYVSMLMYKSGRRISTNNIMMGGIFFGLCVGFITDLIIKLVVNNSMQM